MIQARFERRTARLLAMVVLFGSAAVAQTMPVQPDALVGPEAKQRAETLLEQMTLQEKIGQLTQAAGNPKFGLSDAERDRLIAQGKVGSLLWVSDAKEINHQQHVAIEQSRLHIPILFGFDVIHGYHMAFPVPLGMASSWDPFVEEQAQRYASEDARAAGIRWTFAPMVDIARDARWGRIIEGAGEDPYLGSAMARAQVRGFQGASLDENSVLACAKHFAGYGAADGGRDYDSAYIPEELLRNVYLPPFRAAEQQGVGTFMSALMDLNDVPASGNHWLLTDMLRKDWGFEGFVVSDAQAVGNLVAHGYASDPEDAAYKALTGGVNMDMASLTYSQNLAKLVNEGKVSEAQIDQAVLPILAIKYQLGLFDHPYIDESKVEQIFDRPEGRVLSRKLAGRSMVLLKNDNHTLPLKTPIRNVAVIGPLADSTQEIEGEVGTVRNTNPVSILAGIKNRLGSRATISYVPGFMAHRLYAYPWSAGEKLPKFPTPDDINHVIAGIESAAATADVVIAVLGETTNMSGEAASRSSLGLPGIQEQMLEAAVASGKPVIVVLLNGRPLDISFAAEHASAILEAWYPGTEGGYAVADVLFGDVNPGGKLPITWPRNAGQEPLFYDHNLTHIPEDSPLFTSRYWDMTSKPLYPFGYGLSYTTFKFTNLRLSKTRIRAGKATQVSVDLTNTGAVSGDAVAQVYIHQRYGSASRPARELKGFERVWLQAGETKTLQFPLGKDELQYWNPQIKDWLVEPSRFDVWAGEDSTASLHTELTVTH